MNPEKASDGDDFRRRFDNPTKSSYKSMSYKNVRIFTVGELTCLRGGDYKPTH